FLTVDRQTQNHREPSRLARKAHDVEGVAEIRHKAVNQVHSHQAIESRLAGDIELIELPGRRSGNIEGQATVRSLRVIAQKSERAAEGHQLVTNVNSCVAKHRSADRTLLAVKGTASKNGHSPTRDLQSAIYSCPSCELGVVAHNVEIAVLGDVHESSIEEAGERRCGSVRATSHGEGIGRIQGQRALVHYAPCVEDIEAAIDEHRSRGRVKQSAPDVDSCAPNAPVRGELAGVGEITVNAEDAWRPFIVTKE